MKVLGYFSQTTVEIPSDKKLEIYKNYLDFRNVQEPFQPITDRENKVVFAKSKRRLPIRHGLSILEYFYPSDRTPV